MFSKAKKILNVQDLLLILRNMSTLKACGDKSAVPSLHFKYLKYKKQQRQITYPWSFYPLSSSSASTNPSNNLYRKHHIRLRLSHSQLMNCRWSESSSSSAGGLHYRGPTLSFYSFYNSIVCVLSSSSLWCEHVQYSQIAGPAMSSKANQLKHVMLQLLLLLDTKGKLTCSSSSVPNLQKKSVWYNDLLWFNGSSINRVCY